MKKRIWITTVLCMSTAVFAANPAKISQEIGQNTEYELFLNPFIESELKEVSGQVVLDAGCGIAPHSLIAAKNGASVCAFDTKKQIIEQAQLAVQKAGLESQIAFSEGNMNQLPYASNSFDKALYVNIAAALPASLQLISEDTYQEIGFSTYLREIARVMKEGGHLMVAAPASYGVVFSDGSRPEEAVLQHIQITLSDIGKNPDSETIKKHLSELEEVLHATFVCDKGEVRLVTDEKELKIGQQIWCKIPGDVISAVYHSEEEYLVALKRAGLTCEEIKRPCFFGKVKYDMWRSAKHVCGKSLGEAYINNHPFTIYYAVKRT